MRAESVAFALIFVALWWLIMRAMDRRPIHLKL
jgi:predicted acyltransferase